MVEVDGNPTVRRAVGLYETIGMPARNLSSRTRTEYMKDLRDLLMFLEERGVMTVAHLSLVHLDAYQAEMDRRGYKPATRNRKAHAIKTFCAFLKSQGITDRNLANELIPARIPKREPRFLSRDEYSALLAACGHHPRDTAIIQLFLQTGMRLSELARLTTSDIDLPARISPEPDNVGIVHITRKGGAQQTIPVNYKACRALATWLKARPRCLHQALWVTKFGTPMSSRSIRYSVTGYMKEAGITGASVHTLRHTMATHHIANGTDLKTIQETLGHADLATTALYVSLAKQTQKRALQEHAL